ncbi:capsid assembly scaffolding protein Gp46 family protein [Limosilactobacillus antri]|uniref:capsid assembly scaffolding protein Gp46 family protein n=1 Tax=Limosilactobacillus antri TaxID=227943 RepID=UPI001F5A8260|nr:DUF4355 domain-containing protein [Limosilactobacillus antri]
MNEDTTNQNVTPANEEQGKQEAQEQPKAPKVEGVDSDALLGKLKKRIGKEQSEKNQYKDENDRLKARIKELEGSTDKKKSVKELSDDDKSRDELAAKDKQIQELQNQLDHNKAVKETMAVFQDSGFNPSDEIVEMVVTGDDEQTYANTKAILNLIADVQDKTKQGMLKGKTPRVNGQQAVTKADIMKIKDPLERQKSIAKHLDLFNK